MHLRARVQAIAALKQAFVTRERLPKWCIGVFSGVRLARRSSWRAYAVTICSPHGSRFIQLERWPRTREEPALGVELGQTKSRWVVVGIATSASRHFSSAHRSRCAVEQASPSGRLGPPGKVRVFARYGLGLRLPRARFAVHSDRRRAPPGPQPARGARLFFAHRSHRAFGPSFLGIVGAMCARYSASARPENKLAKARHLGRGAGALPKRGRRHLAKASGRPSARSSVLERSRRRRCLPA